MNDITILGMRTGRTLPLLMDRIAASRAAGRRVILLVPEQYTLQAETELIEGLRVPGLIDTEVLSPARLSLRVREAAGGGPLPSLNERGRVMLLSRILMSEQANLRCYGASAARPGLADRMSAAIAEFEDAGRDAAWLTAEAERQDSALSRARLHDIALVWDAMDRAMAGRFAGSAETARETVRRLGLSGQVTGADVFVCGFDLLSATLCDLLIAAARCANAVTLALTLCASGDRDFRAFRAQSGFADWFAGYAAADGMAVRREFLPVDRSAEDPALRYLESHLFLPVAEPFAGGCEALRVHTAANPYDEAEFAAAQLQDWHRAGIPWDRMAVALSRTDRLPAIMALTLRQANIPCYVIRKESAARHGLCRMLVSALKAVSTGFEQRHVLDCVDSGFSPLTDEEGIRLRAYAEENGIRRGKWTQPFTRGDDAEALEPLRQRLMAPLTELRDGLKAAKNGAEAASVLWHLLESTDAYGKLLAREEALLAAGMGAEASQNRQIWSVALDLLDQMHTIFADGRIGMKDLARVTEAGLGGVSLNSLPPSADMVTVGETGHMLTGEVDALLVMGMQDGITAAAPSGLITERERRELSESARRPVGRSTGTLTALRRSDFYRALTLPRRHLTLTLSAAATDGSAMRASIIVHDLRQLFPEMRVSGGAAADAAASRPLSPAQAAARLPLLLRLAAEKDAPLPDDWLDALRALWHDPAWAPLALQVEKAIHGRVHADPLPPEAAGALFRQRDVSISRLETYAACPYRHFVQEGLTPRERRAYVFRADDRGNFFHAVLARYAALAAACPEWPDLPDERIDALLNEAIAPEREQWADGPLGEDGIGAATAEEAVRAVSRAARMFTAHARQSGFTASSAEVRFGEPGGLPPVMLKLADGRVVALRGVIDRIDRWEGDSGVFLRVVDYKSSTHKLDAVEMFYGLQLQLILYLLAATQHGRGIPAGAYYFTVRDPLVNSDTDLKAAAEEALARELRLSGVTLAEVEVVRAMNGSGAADVIGKVLKNDGTPVQSAMTADRAGMAALMEYGRRTAERLAESLFAGDIGIRPARHGEWTACQHCGYAAICGWDARLPGAGFRDLENDDAWARMVRPQS